MMRRTRRSLGSRRMRKSNQRWLLFSLFMDNDWAVAVDDACGHPTLTHHLEEVSISVDFTRPADGSEVLVCVVSDVPGRWGAEFHIVAVEAVLQLKVECV